MATKKRKPRFDRPRDKRGRFIKVTPAPKKPSTAKRLKPKAFSKVEKANRELQKKLARAEKQLRKHKKELENYKKSKELTPEIVAAAISIDRIKREKERAERQFRDFVSIAPIERLRYDGSISKYSSKLRKVPEVAELYDSLVTAYYDGDIDFDDFVFDMADYYDVDVEDVYTLFHSP